MSIRLAENENKGKPIALAIVSNCLTPYRIAAHLRVVRELTAVHTWSLFTHEQGDAAWKLTAPDEINPVMFGPGEPVSGQPMLKNALKEWRRAGRIIRWLKDHQINVVAMMGYNDLGRVRIMRWCRRSRVPCLLCGDSNIRGDRVAGIKRLIKRMVVIPIVRGVDGILVCGSLGKDYFERYGGSRDRMFYFPYEPDYSLLQNVAPEAIDTAKMRLGMADQRRRFVYAGRLVPVKRVDLVIDAFARIAQQRPQWDLVIIGDGPLRKALRDRVPPELASRVIWAGFVGDPASMAAVYRACDVLVLASDNEPWAVVVNEATAAGLAVVCSDVVGAAAELVRDGVNGYLFPAGDLARLQAALLSASDETRIDGLKGQSSTVLMDWRRKADPVEGLATAIRAVVPTVRPGR
jgi:glycosyltransferase involved in cell wall biosynthesis